jgi:adenylate cyclase
MSEGTQRRLAAIMSADVVGYSRLIAEDEARTLAALRELRRGIVADALERHDGRVIKSMGDGWLMEFDSIGHAVACAQRVQQLLREHDWLSLRIGVHLGDITVDDEDIFGDGVNIAARLQAMAPEGGLLISQDVERQLDGRARKDFAAAGHRRLKNIDKEIGLFVWPAEAIAALDDPDADEGGNKPRLFIEPFAVTGGTEEEALASRLLKKSSTG